MTIQQISEKLRANNWQLSCLTAEERAKVLVHARAESLASTPENFDERMGRNPTLGWILKRSFSRGAAFNPDTPKHTPSEAVGVFDRPEIPIPLPCPFCGRTPTIWHTSKKPMLDRYASVECVNPSCTVNPIATSRHEINGDEPSVHYASLAVANWNIRLPQPQMEPAETPADKPMSFMTSMATEGGRKCPQCGKYAKRKELGNLSFSFAGGRVSMYGHLPGFGCNKESPSKP